MRCQSDPVVSIFRDVFYQSDVFASVLSFRELAQLSRTSRDFMNNSSLYLWRARSKFLRLQSFETDPGTFLSAVSVLTTEADLAYNELEKILRLAIAGGKAEYVEMILEGVWEVERNKEHNPGLCPLLTHSVDDSVTGMSYRSWLFFAIQVCRDGDQNKIILPMLLNVEKEHRYFSDLLLRPDYDINGSNCLMLCAERGELEFVKVMLKAAREAEMLSELLLSSNDTRESPLYCAFKNSHREVALELLDAARCVKVVPELILMKTDSHYSCLIEAVLLPDVEMLCDLLQSARVTGIMHQLLMTNIGCFQLAIRHYNPKIFTTLLEAAQEEESYVLSQMLSMPCGDGRSCLFDAVSSNNPDAVLKIMEASRRIPPTSGRGFLSELLPMAPPTGSPYGGMSCLHYIVSCYSNLEDINDVFAKSMHMILVQLLQAAVQEGVLYQLLYMRYDDFGWAGGWTCLHMISHMCASADPPVAGLLSSACKDVGLIIAKPFENLPDVVWTTVLQFLTETEGRAISCTCKSISALTKLPPFVWGPPLPVDTNSIMKNIDRSEVAGIFINWAKVIGVDSALFAKRLKILVYLLNECHEGRLLTYETPEFPQEACVLGWSKMTVYRPKKLNDKIRDMVACDYGGIWKRNVETDKVDVLLNPTWRAYELLSSIGVQPKLSSRGDEAYDPGKWDMLYYRDWEFKKKSE
jgi:hypothetical protein